MVDKMKNTVGIHQPNFAPWLGYFYKIYESDVFIFLDDVQVQKKGASYSNRVTILGNGTTQYLTVPILKGEGYTNLNEATFFKGNWNIKAIKTIQANYGKANFFKRNFPFVEELFMFKTDYIAEFNINFITEICKKLDINVTFKRSSEFSVEKTSTDRLIALINSVDCDVYISGKGGDNYQEHAKFEDANIDLVYSELPVFDYAQFNNEQFVKGLSILDAIFNVGYEELKEKLFHKKY
jgi:hypothetical protein